jgi:hypothetical protein
MSVEWFDRESLDRTIQDRIQKTDVVLDVGCGIRPQAFFVPKLHVLCEPYAEYLRILQNRYAQRSNVLILQSRWMEALRALPDRAVDSVFLVDVIEHLEKEEGTRLVAECERLARKQILIFTPLGFMPQDYASGERDGWGLTGIEWQVHKSGWTPDDFDASWRIVGALCRAMADDGLVDHAYDRNRTLVYGLANRAQIRTRVIEYYLRWPTGQAKGGQVDRPDYFS